MKIICDNNIWYSESQQVLNQLKTQFVLVGTFSNLFELCTSEKHIEDYLKRGLPKKAIRNLIKSSAGQDLEYFFPPVLYLEYIMINTGRPNDPRIAYSALFDFTAAIANGDRIRPEMEQAFKQWVDGENSVFAMWASLMDDVNLSMIQSLNSQDKIKSFIANELYSQTQTEIVWWASLCMNPQLLADPNPETNIELNKEMDIRLRSYDWAKIELFVRVYGQFRIELVRDKSRKVEPNDFYDLWNLVYVQPGDKYWTHEKLWNRLIKELGLNDYLFTKPTMNN